MYSIHSESLPQCRLPDLGQSLWEGSGGRREGKWQRVGEGKVDGGGGGGGKGGANGKG